MQSLENFATCSAQNMKDANCTYKKPNLPYFDDFETISTEFDLACDNRYVSRLGFKFILEHESAKKLKIGRNLDQNFRIFDHFCRK